MAESLESQDVFEYITTESNNWKTARVPLTNSKDWSMYEYIQRCKNVANGWYHSGKNDDTRPYNDIVTPIINVAFRSEGFEAREIIPYVNDAKEYYKSFLVKKYHPQWARKNELDTLIDEVVESSVIFDLVLIKDVNNVRPEVVDLTTLAFCDQTDIMSGPICIRHQYSVAELYAQKGKWDDKAIDFAVQEARQEKKVGIANDQSVKTPGKYVEVFELRGNLPAQWLDEEAEVGEYSDQLHIVAYYTDKSGGKQGITLYKGDDKPLRERFKALKIDQVRSKGRACGKSIVETLFDPQVWNNYAEIKIKEMLDSAINVIVSDSDELGGQKLSDLKQNAVLKQERGATTTRLDGTLQNLQNFQNYQTTKENSARIIGSASDAQLGTNPVSGTPFSLQALVVQQGQGIHEYRQGKIATFFADVLYRDLILGYLVKEMNGGKEFSEELSFDELEYVAEAIATNQVETKKKQMMIDGKIMKTEEMDMLMEEYKAIVKKGGTRKFFEVLKGELDDIPMEVYVNIKGKQKAMAENADKLTNIIREIIKAPQAFAQIPGLGKTFNELLENSGLSPVDFTSITKVEETEQPVVTA